MDLDELFDQAKAQLNATLDEQPQAPDACATPTKAPPVGNVINYGNVTIHHQTIHIGR